MDPSIRYSFMASRTEHISQSARISNLTMLREISLHLKSVITELLYLRSQRIPASLVNYFYFLSLSYSLFFFFRESSLSNRLNLHPNVRNLRSAIEKAAPLFYLPTLLKIAYTYFLRKDFPEKLCNNYSLVKRTANKQEAWFTRCSEHRIFSPRMQVP